MPIFAPLTRPTPRDACAIMRKVAPVTLAFWIMKICATTLGETGGDEVSMTLGIGYAMSSAILLGAFVALLGAQLAARRFHPLLYWSVILATSTSGTTISDFMDRSLGLGYATGASILLALLLMVLGIWYACERSLSVERVRSRRAETFYWMAILVSNTLGTALGDFLADDSGLGFGGSALVIGTALAARLRHCPPLPADHATVTILIAHIVVAIIALLHVWFLVLEMLLWTRPTGLRAFGLTPEFARQSKVLAANQGLYNGFLAAGLVWGLWLGGREGLHVLLFFLGCVLVAGLYGGFTATRKVLLIQAAPALLGIVLLLI